ncbi:MAG: 50S ribosomal protein L2 [archaeon]
MGKRLITQRRGRGTFTYRAHSHRWLGEMRHRKYDDLEKAGMVEGTVKDLVHCPGHSAPIATIRYNNGDEIMMAAPYTIKVNDKVCSGATAPFGIGNTLPLKSIPDGTEIFNIESQPGDGGKFVRASGGTAKILGKMGEKIIVRLPSKKQKLFDAGCRATIGIIAGGGRTDKPIMKAGKNWHAMHSRGKLYPRTSAVAMNAVDHPFGCGRGRHIGKPKTPPRNAPPGRNVGLIRARRTGRAR